VNDSRFVSPELRKANWPLSWSDWSRPDAEPACLWKTDDSGRSFSVACADPEASAMLRYRHFLPSAEEWLAMKRQETLPDPVRPRIIDDFQPYNAIATRPHWVGDLAIEFELENRGDGGSLALDLVEAGKAHRCVFNLATGDVRLTIKAADSREEPKARTPVHGKGSWRILFANVDDELSLFVNGRRIEFDRPTIWMRSIEDAETAQPYDGEIEPGRNESGDLAPVGIKATGASVRVANLRVLRDVYYIGALDVGSRPGELIERDRLEFPLEADQFFVLGDNSAASKDGRMWIQGHHVDRGLLVGKALAIFWPHAVPASWAIPVKIGGAEVRLPSWPNFARMGFVR
jgi:signal peptidase I